ncbi:N-acetylmuramoyl-L-alanine amidase [Viscerimonas tarda]
MALICVNELSAATYFTVVIDPGHGGKDGGAVRGDSKEKEINLAVALNLGKLIEDNFSDVKVVYTRKTNVFVDLYRRAEIANKEKANLFISIHTNSTAAKTTTATGVDTYILGLARSEENKEVQQRENAVILLEDNYKQRYQGFDPNSPESYIIFEFMTNKYMEQSLEFAASLQQNFKSVSKRSDRGVKQAGFLVLRETAMPSVLIELGFINNPAEAKYLTSAIGQRTLASAIFAGFKNYKKEFDKKQGSKSITSAEDESVQNPVVETKKDNDRKYVNKPAKPVVSQPVQPQVNVPDSQVPPKQTASNPLGFVSKPKHEPVIVSQPKANLPTEQPKVEQPTKPATEPATAKPVTETSSAKPATSSNETEYRVQILTSGAEISAGSPKLKGLSPVGFYIDKGTYKYTYGSTTDYNEALMLQREARAKFSDAFIVEFKNGKRIK